MSFADKVKSLGLAGLIAAGAGNTNAQTNTANVVAGTGGNAPVLSIKPVANNQMQVTVTGPSGQPIILQRSETLNPPIWKEVSFGTQMFNYVEPNNGSPGFFQAVALPSADLSVTSVAATSIAATPVAAPPVAPLSTPNTPNTSNTSNSAATTLTNLTLAWNPVAGATGGYVVGCGNKSGNYTQFVEVPYDQAFAKVTVPASGTNYFAVVARGASNVISGFSTEAVWTPPAPTNSLPTPPSNKR